MDLEKKFDVLLAEMKNICNKIDDRFEQVDNRINSLSAEIGALHRTFFKLDVETQNNLRILSDAVKQHNDKQLLFEKQLYRLNDQLDNTTFRVSLLEDNHSY